MYMLLIWHNIQVNVLTSNSCFIPIKFILLVVNEEYELNLSHLAELGINKPESTL